MSAFWGRSWQRRSFRAWSDWEPGRQTACRSRSCKEWRRCRHRMTSELGSTCARLAESLRFPSPRGRPTPRGRVLSGPGIIALERPQVYAPNTVNGCTLNFDVPPVYPCQESHTPHAWPIWATCSDRYPKTKWKTYTRSYRLTLEPALRLSGRRTGFWRRSTTRT